MIRTLRKSLFSIFRCDLRALAVFRIGLGILLLIDIIDRASDLRAHYTDSGLLPRWAAMELHGHPAWLSLYYLNGSTSFTVLLFLLTALCGITLILGWKTRLSIIAAWVLTISIHTRNPVVLQGGDVLYRLILFWALFLPIGERYAVEEEKHVPPSADAVVSAATIALLVQVMCLYFFTGVLKTAPEWHANLSAIYFTLKIDQLVTPFGHHLLEFPRFLKFMTWATWYLEVVGAFLLLIPWAPIRLLTILTFFSFQMGLFLSLRVWTFPWICTVAMIPFLPSSFWNGLERLFHRTTTFGEAATPWVGSKLWNGVVFFLTFYVMLWNIGGIPGSPIGVPAGFRWIGQVLRIDQFWNMFAPYPLKDDGWYVIPGTLLNQQEVDLFRGGAPVSWEKPPWIAYTYKNQRWQKYMMNLWSRENASSRLYYAKYLCRDWNEHHTNAEILTKLKIYFMREDTLPDGERTPQKVLLWDHDCFKKDN